MMYFVVRHKRTQRLLPQSFAIGSTWWEPEQHNLKKDDLPRLFYSAKAAKSCVITWAKGHAVKKTSYGYDRDGNRDDDEWLEYEPVAGRERDQLEVVPVHLRFGEPK